MTVVLQRDHAPVLHFVVATDDAADMQPPDPVGGKLVIPELAERDTQFGRPARVGQVDMCLALPYGIPAQVDIEFVGDYQVSLVSSQVDIEFGRRPVIMVGIERHTDQVAHAVVVAVSDETVHLLRPYVLAIDTDVDIFIIVEQLHIGRRIGELPFIRDDLDETVRPFPLLRPEVFVQTAVHDRPLPRHLRYGIGTFVSIFEGDDRVLLCMTKGSAQQQ